MKTMIKQIVYLIVGGAMFSAFAQLESLQHDWEATLKVVDDNSNPVVDAETTVYYMLTNNIGGVTDTNGIFVAFHHDQSADLAFQIQKSGYYPSRSDYHMGFYYKFDKWNPTQTIVLRKIGNPIPMYAKRVETKLQKEDEPMGFDLMAGDWVAPYGKGKDADMFFTVHRTIMSDREFNADLKATFQNRGDGIAVAPPESASGSEFKTSRTAADNGYEPERSWHYSNSKRRESVFGYFIRVRTVLDENGNVQSALYGKIRGDFRFYAGTKAPRAGVGFDYYLNPTPNNRNLEFDPKQNLMNNLKPLEEVDAP